jgi:alkylation response protein AidB-like acyl-CoA dehydrogenase
MNLLPDEQQTEIMHLARDFLASKLSVRRYQNNELQGAGYSDELWQELADLGWFGIGVKEKFGGLGLGLAEEILIAREYGRQLVSPTVIGTALAIHLLADVGNDEVGHSLINGSARVSLGLSSNLQVQDNQISANILAFDSNNTDFVLTWNHHYCYLVETHQLTKAQDEPCTDESLSLVSAALNATPVVAISQNRLLLATMTTYLSATLSGIAAATQDAAAAYATSREQFGRAIGSFQAINHLCADMAVYSEASWAQCVFAALNLQNRTSTAINEAASAAVIAEQAAINNARSNIQIHGGVGFTSEYDAHFYVKRAHVYRQLVQASIDTTEQLIPRSGNRGNLS